MIWDGVAAEELDPDCLVCCQVDGTGRGAGVRSVLRAGGWQGLHMRPELIKMWKTSHKGGKFDHRPMVSMPSQISFRTVDHGGAKHFEIWRNWKKLPKRPCWLRPQGFW